MFDTSWRYDKRTKCVKMKDGYWVDAERWLSDPTWLSHLRGKSWWDGKIEANFLEEMEKCVADYKAKRKARP